jgi:GH24 family phage-related lysozyme (muramidase)
MPRPVAWQTMFISIAIERSKLWFHEPNKTWQTNRVSFACPEGAQTFFVGAHDPETIAIIIRRKFRSQTSDNMDRWKIKGGKSQRREKRRREKVREEKESEERRCKRGKR